MTFSDKIFELQKKYPKDVILIKNGIFFVAVGKDALFLNNELGLKRTCFGKETCKVGFLVKSAESYINSMKSKNISFRMYVLDDVKDEELICKNNGIAKNMYTNTSTKCSKCERKIESDEDIIKKLKFMYKN